MNKSFLKLLSRVLVAFLLPVLVLSCEHEKEIEEPDNPDTPEVISGTFFPAVVQMDQEKVTVQKCDTENGQYRLSFSDKAPDIKKGSVVVVEENVVLVTEAKVADKTVDFKGRLGDLTYVFRNVSFTLSTSEAPESRGMSSGNVYTPEAIVCGTDTLYSGTQTRDGHTYFGDDFRIWDKTYSETATVYKSSDAIITATPTLSSSMNAAFLLEFLDETKDIIDDIAFLKAKQFNFTARLYGDLTTALNITADIKKSGSYKGDPERIVKDLLPKMKMKFQIGLIPFWVVMGCDLYAKGSMEYSGELHFEQNMSATYSFEEGIKYMPYSAYDIADNWKRFDTSTDIPAPIVSGKASWTGQFWVYPKFFADVDYIIGPGFEIKPYLKTNISVGFTEGEADITKNYLANTASAHFGIDAAAGVDHCLVNAGVSPDLGMHDFGTIKEWEILRSPASLRLLSSSSDKVRKGVPLTLKFQVNENSFGKEYPSPFFPIVKIEIPKNDEYYYRFAGTSGTVEFNYIPKASDEILYAKVFDASGHVIDQVQFGDGSMPEPTVSTGQPHDVGQTSAIVPLTWESEAEVKEVGVYYSTTSSTPSFTDKAAGGNIATKEVSISGLTPATHYYARGYIKVEAGGSSEVVMGEVVEFTTPEENKPAIKVSQSLIDFGSIKKGERARESFVISNTGTADLTVKLTKAADAFSIDWTSATIAPGAEKKVYVTFLPDNVGSFSSSIQIESNAESGNQKIVLRGKATTDVEEVAKIELSKSDLDFGEVKTGESNSLNITVRNTGTADLKVSVSGASSPVTLSWKEATIAPNSSKVLSVTYSPEEVSDLSSVLRFTSNATNGTKTVSLSGKGISGSGGGGETTTFPVIALSVESLSFGNVTVGETGKQKITISNTGNKTLTVKNISFPTGYTGDWSSATIESGKSKTLNITFSPTSAQAYNGNLTIESDASNATSKVVSIKGTGVAKPEPKLSVSTNLVNFGDQIKFTQETKSFTIKNSGTGTLVISSITKSSNYGDLFSISGWTSGGSIAAGASKTITVAFQPLEERTYEETITIVSSNAVGTKTQTVTLRGTGVPEPEDAVIKLGSSSLSFGSVEVGESVSKSFTVTNSGTTALNISSIKVVAGDNTVNPDYFTVTPTGSCTISPSKSKTFTVTFSPEDERDYSAVVSIKSNASNATQGNSIVDISGTGTAATSKILAASPSSISFGIQTVGNRTSKNFTVKNNGTKAVTLYSIEASEGFDLGSTWTEGSNYGLGAGSSKTFSIAFAPQEARAYNGSIVIKSNASNGDLVIPLSGTGAEAQGYLEITSGESLDFGTVNLGASGALITRIKNTGEAKLNITGIQCPDGFSATCNVSSLNAGSNTSINVSFTPTQAKTYSGTIIVNTDAENSSVSIDVTGTGKQSASTTGFVDMGLSVKWASTNVGASKPEDYGHYVAWGETSTKSQYTYKNYKYFNANAYLSEEGWITKYCSKDSWGYQGFFDPLKMLTYDDDYAQYKLKGLARIPTRKEWEELYKNSTWQWVEQSGINGYMVTSKINGNTIFIPAGGFIDSSNDSVNEIGYYWSSTLDTNTPNYSYCFELRSSKAWYSSRDRYKGMTIRAVEDYTAKPRIYIYTNSLDFTGTKIGTSASKTVAVTNNGKATLHITDIYTNKRWAVDWTTASIEPGQYKTLTITYTPVEDPNLVIDDPLTWDDSTMSIDSDAFNDDHFIIYLKAYGIP